MPAAVEAQSAPPPDSVDFIQKDDAGRVFLGLANRYALEKRPHATNISTKSEPLMEKNGTSASPAIAFASNVLPHPGSPISSTPRGIRPPSRWKRLGFFRNSTTS
jgi:hypothetical protein